MIRRSATITAAEQTLASRLESHAGRYSPFYQGFLSDHAPMGTLALTDLGASEKSAVGWYERYTRRLEEIDRAPARYRALYDAAARDLTARPAEEVLAEQLPVLISGWARNAYHPLIRLAYGYRSGIRSEIAAGLAYLGWCGPDPVLENMAREAGRSSGSGSAIAAFEAAAGCAPGTDLQSRFDGRLASVIGHDAFGKIKLPRQDVLRAVSRLALAVFAATHDFFALHLVTGAHAFRILYPFAGAQRDALFGLGILAGYAATGAPAFTADAPASTPVEDRIGKQTLAQALSAAIPDDDDHDIKLACSCLAQTGHFADPGYAHAALDYLESR